jgi:anti-anti-sigma factor
MSNPTFASLRSASTAPDPPLPFCSTRRAEGTDSIQLVLAGELDLASRSIFEGQLDDAQTDAASVTLDLLALSFIDCACLAVLFEAATRAGRDHNHLALLDARGQVRRVLDLTGAPTGVAVLERNDA